MITTIFSKSKPINFLIVFFISVMAVFFAVFKFNNQPLTTYFIIKTALTFICCYVSILVVNFIVSKNYLSQKTNYEILIFSLFLLALPQIFLHSSIVLSNFFILLALRRIISFRTKKSTVKKLFDAGLLIGVASLFYFWAILFFILIFVALLLYAEDKMRHWIVPFLGLATVIIIALGFSIIINGDLFSLLPISSFISLDFSSYNSVQFIVVITMLLSFGIWSSIFFLKDIKKKMRTYRPSYKVVFIAFIIAFVVAMFALKKNGSELLFIITPLVIIITNYIETIEEKWFKEVFVGVLFITPFVLLML